MSHHDPQFAACLQQIDAVLASLVQMRVDYPRRSADLTRRIDSALDERLRLMWIRDQRLLPSKPITKPDGPEPHPTNHITIIIQ